jgi:DnaJ-class molecular chaperone
VSKTATPDEIKKSFRKLAIKWHPDKNQDNKEQASEKFRELSEAYEHLSDEVKKKEYDIYGHAGQKKYTQSTFSTTRADDIFKAFFSQFGFDSAFDQDIFGKRYGANTFTRRDFGSMGSNYEDILKGFSNGTAKPSYTRANTYGSGYTYGTTTGGKTTYTTSSGTGSSYGTTGGRTYVRVGSTGGYGSYGGYGTSTGSGTVIGGD